MTNDFENKTHEEILQLYLLKQLEKEENNNGPKKTHWTKRFLQFALPYMAIHLAFWGAGRIQKHFEDAESEIHTTQKENQQLKKLQRDKDSIENVGLKNENVTLYKIIAQQQAPRQQSNVPVIHQPHQENETPWKQEFEALLQKFDNLESGYDVLAEERRIDRESLVAYRAEIKELRKTQVLPMKACKMDAILYQNGYHDRYGNVDNDKKYKVSYKAKEIIEVEVNFEFDRPLNGEDYLEVVLVNNGKRIITKEPEIKPGALKSKTFLNFGKKSLQPGTVQILLLNHNKPICSSSMISIL